MLVAYGGGGGEYGVVHWVSVGCWRGNGGSFRVIPSNSASEFVTSHKSVCFVD